MVKKIAIAQINTTALDVYENYNKAIEYINKAKKQGANIIIFPCAYLCGGHYFDVLEKFPIISHNVQNAIEKLSELAQGIDILIGFIQNKKDAIAIIKNGKVENIITSSNHITDILGLKTSFIFRNEGDVNPQKEVEFIIDFTQSISKKNSEYIRNNTLSNIAKIYNAYVLQINKIGANDELSFDGSSRLYSNKGNLLARGEFFKEDLLIIDDFKGEIKSMPKGLDVEPEKEFSLNYENDLERMYLSICQATKDYFSKNCLKKAVLGLSGGLDSTVCAVILTDVLGKENVLGISMPSKITTDLSKQDAYKLAKNLGINFKEIPISPIVETLKQTFGELKGAYTMDNFQARTRATILFGCSNEIDDCISIATSDKSEAYMGYATINGDMSGGFAPIADVTKTKLFAFAKWLNSNREQKNVIPQSIIEKRPGAELAINPKTGKPLMAEEALMPYEFLDEVIWRIEILRQSKEEMLNEIFVYEKNHKIDREQKKQWLDKFFFRMISSTCKGNLMPIYPLVDEVSINKKIYKAPITCNINFERIKL